MFTIGKSYHFDASHQLDHLPSSHKCSGLHGHRWLVEVEIAGDIGSNSFVVDYGEIDQIINPLIDQLDHHHLNEVLSGVFPGYTNLSIYRPSAENLAHLIFWSLYDRLSPYEGRFYLRSITVKESPTSWATYYRDAV